MSWKRISGARDRVVALPTNMIAENLIGICKCPFAKGVIMVEIVIERLAEKVLQTATESAGTQSKVMTAIHYQTVQLMEAFHVGGKSSAILLGDFDLIR